MADAVTSQTLVDGDKIAVMKFTNVSDGTGESDVNKVDVSALTARSRDGKTCTGVSLRKIWWMTTGMSAKLEWDATADVELITLPADREGQYDFSSFGGIQNNGGSGVTGDIFLTTSGHTAGDTYWIVVELGKKYE